MLTLADLVIKLRDRLQTAIEQKDAEEAGLIHTTIGTMIEVSYGEGNEELIGVLEDLRHASIHAGMGFFKMARPIPTDEQIKAVFQSDEE